MKSNNLSSRESAKLIYSYISISLFLVMFVSIATKNLENCEKTIEFHPIVSLVIVVNMIAMTTLHYYKKFSFQRG